MATRSPRGLSLVSILLCCSLFASYAEAQSPAPQPAAGSPSSAPAADDDGQTPIHVRALPKNLLEDQEAFLTTPFRMKSDNLFFVVPAIFASSILVGSDTAIEAHLPKGSSTISLAANASDAGMAALLGAGGGLFLWDRCPRMSTNARPGSSLGKRPLTPTSIPRPSSTSQDAYAPTRETIKGPFLRRRFLSFQHHGR